MQQNKKPSYQAQNRVYIEMIRPERDAMRQMQKPLVKKLLEYLETHPVTVKSSELLYAAENDSGQGIEGDVMSI